MRRVLIVSPHFPPVNAPDAHRVRTALPYLRDQGWEPTVLAVEPRCVERVQDPLLLRSIPAEVEVVRVAAWPVGLTRLVGLGSLALRARGALRTAGDRLLAARRFDAVFFSTTEFPVTTLGLRWRDRFGVPFVVDWQDPWLSDYCERTGTPPPGGRLKYAFAQQLARRGEPRVVRGAAALVAVAEGYIRQLAARYPDWNSARATVLPFGAPEGDFELLDTDAVVAAGIGAEFLGRAGPPGPPGERTARRSVPTSEAYETWLYAGRGGADLHCAARGLFAAVRADRAAHPERWQNRRLLFLGTSYAPAERAVPTLAPLAAEFGLGDLVVERTDRAPYFSTLALLRSAARVFILGSDDADYTASKIYPYLLARRPLLAVLHESSDAAGFLRRVGGGTVVTFAEGTSPEVLAQRLLATGWLQAEDPGVPALDAAVFAGCTVRAMTAKLAGVLDAAAVSFPH